MRYWWWTIEDFLWELDDYLNQFFEATEDLFVLASFFFGCVAPVILIILGAVLANVKRERGWLLLSLVGGGMLVRWIGQTVLATVLGMALFF